MNLCQRVINVLLTLTALIIMIIIFGNQNYWQKISFAGCCKQICFRTKSTRIKEALISYLVFSCNGPLFCLLHACFSNWEKWWEYITESWTESRKWLLWSAWPSFPSIHSLERPKVIEAFDSFIKSQPHSSRSFLRHPAGLRPWTLLSNILWIISKFEL